MSIYKRLQECLVYLFHEPESHDADCIDSHKMKELLDYLKEECL